MNYQVFSAWCYQYGFNNCQTQLFVFFEKALPKNKSEGDDFVEQASWVGIERGRLFFYLLKTKNKKLLMFHTVCIVKKTRE